MQRDMINEEFIKSIVEEVVANYTPQAAKAECQSGVSQAMHAQHAMGPVLQGSHRATSQDDVEILVEASGRHVHLSERDIERLFGKGYKLTPKKNLSQIGQFACEERVTLIGPKNIYRNVAVLGPARKETQVELSLSDARFLGIDAPLKMSGDLKGAADIIIATDKESIAAKECAIVAKNHIHMTPAQANQWGFSDGQEVSVAMRTARPVTFNGVVIRVSSEAGLAMHIDFDEANSCMFKTGNTGVINATKPVNCCVEMLNKKSEACAEAGTALNKRFITEEDIKKALRNTNATKISVPKTAILSAPAKDYVNKEKITLMYI